MPHLVTSVYLPQISNYDLSHVHMCDTVSPSNNMTEKHYTKSVISTRVHRLGNISASLLREDVCIQIWKWLIDLMDIVDSHRVTLQKFSFYYNLMLYV